MLSVILQLYYLIRRRVTNEAPPDAFGAMPFWAPTRIQNKVLAIGMANAEIRYTTLLVTASDCW
jgi:hypothetical protein